MNRDFEIYYTNLDDNDRHIFHVLALSTGALNVFELIKIVNKRYIITSKRLNDVLNAARRLSFVKEDYRNFFQLNAHVLTWIFPLIKGYQMEKDAMEAYAKKHFSYYQQNEINKYLLTYLDALLYKPNKLKVCENDLFRKVQADYLTPLFEQPLYDSYYDRISEKMMDLIYPIHARKIIGRLESLDRLLLLDEKLTNHQSADRTVLRAMLTYKRGDWQKTQALLDAVDSPFYYYAQASSAVVNGDCVNALELFETGLVKQRREKKQLYLPNIPEAALFYLISLLSGERKQFLPVLGRIIDAKTKAYSATEELFTVLCRYLTSNTADSPSDQFKNFSSKDDDEASLWRIIALGITGEKPLNPDEYIDHGLKLTKKALSNGYSMAAYEAAYALMNMDSKEAEVMYGELSAKMQYKPVLSQVKRMESWEKQINAYLSLDAVKTLIKQEGDIGKTRVAYRFFPAGYALPMLQTKLSIRGWSAGHLVNMSKFVEGKTDGMTEQDKRIAAVTVSHAHSLDRKAIAEMTGHPYIFLENSDVPVELIAARPILNVVESAKSGYKLESDLKHFTDDIFIEKETNTRYKIYRIDKYQHEILEAVKKGGKIPKAGKEMLVKVLEHFSAYLTVHSDLIIEGVNIQTRQVETDSRIYVQLLPFGEGLKAELFVKPFGSHPPYCKPGQGGKSLLANQQGERLQVTRNLKLEVQNADRILTEVQTVEGFDSNDGTMTFDNPYDALELLEILRNHKDLAIAEWPEGERMKVRYAANFDSLKLRMKSGVDWFSLEGEMELDEHTVVSIGRLLEMVTKSHGRFVELTENEFIVITDQLKRRLAELSAFSTVSKNKVVINRFASASLVDSFNDFKYLNVNRAWRDFRMQIKEAQDTDVSLPTTLQAELRPYQEEGYRWMSRLAAWGAGACLADDMGLGKTVQAIAVMLRRASIGPALVISPVSVLPNWISEVSRFAPSLNIKTLNSKSRTATLASIGAGDLLITSYGLLHSEVVALTAVQWATVTLDEAHIIKNYDTKTSRAAMQLEAGFRLALTGTPIQNHLGEIWNLFQFINPGLLGVLPHFTDQFIKPANKEARQRLKKLIAPFILRRTKVAVMDELPPKTEIIRKIELSKEETAFYEALRRRAIETIQNDSSPQGARHLKALAEIIRLRQACCNPKLVEPQMNIESTKLATFMEIAAELKENGHCALVFSQFVTHLAIVRKALDKQGFSYQYLDGSTSSANREAAVKDFQAGKSNLFLISLKAGGLGLNLTAADFVIHLDPWWNPAVEDQASDRAHRIGQNRPVTVYRLVAEHTIEEKIIQLHNTKRDLADSLLEGSDQSAKLSMEELMALIRGEK